MGIGDTSAFEKARAATMPEPAGVISMWVNVWGNRGRGDVMIGAPTLAELAKRWEQITNSDFDETLAQQVIVTSIKNVMYAPDAVPHD